MNMLKLKPFVADNIWGGTKLRDEFDIESDKTPLAEAWVLSAHPKGQSIISGGEFAGRTLGSVLENEGREWFGTNCAGAKEFPILIKLIDAKNDLSVQVHPGDDYAREHENQLGKTECWFILETDEGAHILYSLNREMTREELRTAIENDRILDCVNSVPVEPGMFFFIPSGTVHAICGGILLAEVQQSSDVTYRIFDYHRLNDNGKERELHQAQAGDVINLQPLSVSGTPQGETVYCEGYSDTELTENGLFKVHLLDIEEAATVIADESSFLSLVALDGNGVAIHGDTVMTLYKGESVFIPAGFGEVSILGSVKVLLTSV